MAYVPGLKHDIFISYAHADDAADPQGVRWVTEFQVYFKRAINQYLAGFEPDVFFAPLDLHPNQPIKAVLADARRSALFLPVISPSYVERLWTNQELEAFSEAVPETDRIFAVELLPPIGDYPMPLRDLKRTQFWRKEEKQGSAPRKFTPQYEPKTYMDLLGDVAYPMANRLREMNPESKPEAEPTSSFAGKKVLLAEVTDDLQRIRRQVREHLEQYKITVLPDRDYPEAGVELVKAFNADLAKADLFVQLLSEVRSIKSECFKESADAEPKSQGLYQYEAAKRRSIPILQWRSPEFDPATVTHWDRGLLAGPDVLSMGLQEFIKEIKKALECRTAGLSKKQQKGDFLFINADLSDKKLADELREAFKENPDCMAMGPLFEGPADKILEDLEASLRECSALLLIYGNSAPPWVRAQQRRYNKLEKFRDEPPRSKIILFGPPSPKSESDLGSSGGFKKVDCQNGITAEHLERILAELRR